MLWSGLSPRSPRPTRTRGRARRAARTTSPHVGPDNRMISFPYPKSLTANPFVNQGAALLVTDADTARALGIPEDRWVYPLGRRGRRRADRPACPRPRTTTSPRSTSPCGRAGAHRAPRPTTTTWSSSTAASRRCPSSPRRALGRDADATPISVTGGLSFVGGPGSNYLTHSLAAMVERLRDRRWHRLRARRRHVQHQAPLRSCSRDHPRDDGAYPDAAARRGRAPPAGDRPGARRRGLRGPGDGRSRARCVFGRDGAPESGASDLHGRARRTGWQPRSHDRDTLERLTDGTGTGRPRGHGVHRRPSRIPRLRATVSRTRDLRRKGEPGQVLHRR